mgnify:CR=1 FL=1
MDYDTPETVAEKMKQIPTILAIANHYIGEWHDGDYFDCARCHPNKDEAR